MKAMRYLDIFTVVLVVSITSIKSSPNKEFDPNKGIHPFYLNQTPGYNASECKEKTKCRANCPEILLKPGFSRSFSQGYLRAECLRRCDELACKLNSGF
ncbi:MAG: hypothetical protein O9301_03005 [Leptospira sp.]|nr:hypothetical protein [Leptospira sp.]